MRPPRKLSRDLIRRAALFFLVALLPLSAANIRLYLADGGGDMMVSEYEVLEDRVRYYSVERSAWEEIPLALVDLEKTRRLEKQQEQSREERAAEERVERTAERKARTELHDVPIDDGVYYRDGDRVVTVAQAELKTETSKGRTLLKVFSPLPMAGKQTVEIEGERSEFVVTTSRPMFYMRFETTNRLGILRLKDKKKARLVQVIQVVPQSKEIFEEQEEIEVFRQQYAPGVYKIWPVDPIPAGEYAVFEYTPGEGNIRIWDFSCQPSAADSAADQEDSPADSGKDP
ncbi:MAG: hypothetical protein WD733_18130 [Bryobacterales bacterium]